MVMKWRSEGMDSGLSSEGIVWMNAGPSKKKCPLR